jgi:hypothetical protein
MELIINENIIPRVRNSYRVDLEFMFGDADGYEHESLFVPLDEFEENKEDFFTYLACITSLIELDSKAEVEFVMRRSSASFMVGLKVFMKWWKIITHIQPTNIL